MAIKFLFLIIFTFASSSDSTGQQHQNIQAKNITLVKQLFDYFNRHDWEKMAKLYSDPAEFKDPSLSPNTILQTRQQTTGKYTRYQSLSPDIHDSVTHIYPSGDQYIIVEFISSGTSIDRIKWSIPICTVFKIEYGMITVDNTYYNNKQ